MRKFVPIKYRELAMINCEGAFDQIVVLKMLRDLLRVMVYAPTQSLKAQGQTNEASGQTVQFI